MITLTQSIIDKLTAWEDAGNELHVGWFPDNAIARETKTAWELSAGQEVYMISLTARKDTGRQWYIVLYKQEQADRDFYWAFAEDIYKYINKKGVA